MVKGLHGRSYAAERLLMKPSKTMDLLAIAQKTARTPESILATATRLGIKIKTAVTR